MKRRAPHHRSFRAWVMREYGRPYEPRQIFHKFDRDIWHIVCGTQGRLPSEVCADVNDWYAAMIEAAASRLMSAAAKSSGEVY